MADSISVRYAEALFNVAEGQKELEAFQNQLEFMIEAINLKPKFKLLLQHPCIDKREKQEIIKKVFSDKVKQELLNFLFVIIDNKRISYLEQIKEEFDLRVNNTLDVYTVKVISAVELKAKEKKLLEQILIKKIKSKIKMKYETDKKTLGGLIIKVGNKVFDGSLRHQINELKRLLAEKVKGISEDETDGFEG
ncbi:MAG: F-type H+-transporting ATPase subunit delta [Thermosediminibacterales bacterium]|nr:F-type H+-transporting ATPase subunit delta [Thermosediminibacterales bacterium]MDK2836003.1 F-type H+-transporting ATPase subunit delta [Thermosediminibacterales bacterium]